MEGPFAHEKIAQTTKDHRMPSVTPLVLFSLCAFGSLVLALFLWLEARRTQQAVPRLRVVTGRVRELESVLSDRNAGHVRSTTLVAVEFQVNGRPYCCRTLKLFAGNRHVGDVGGKYNFTAGQQVGVYYDPEDPRRSALIIDKPRHDMVVIALVLAAAFAVMAAVSFGSR